MKSQKLSRDLIYFTIFLLVAIAPLTVSQSCSSEVVIICSDIKNDYWPTFGDVLTCEGDSSINSTFSDSAVSSVVHRNKSEVTNLDGITGLDIYFATVKFIPFGIKNHFPNLKGLQFSFSSLISVKKENLKEFGNSLEELWLRFNQLISIDADLFEHNLNMKVINLNGNPIRHIEPEFFTNLKNLRSLTDVALDLNYGYCMSQVFDTERGHNIATFKWKSENCTDSTARVQTLNFISNSTKCSHEEIRGEKDERIN